MSGQRPRPTRAATPGVAGARRSELGRNKAGKPRATARSSRTGVGTLNADASYFTLSTRPLYILVFLVPLLLYYESASAFHVLHAADGVVETIRARKLLEWFFRLFGVGGLYLPGVVVVVMLLVWHILVRDPWRIKPRVPALMALETPVWTLPLLVLGHLLYRLLGGGAGSPPAGAGMGAMAVLGSTGDLASRPFAARAAIAVGAGLYEEMLFRMMLIALLHAVMVDIMGMPHKRGAVLSVLLAAVAFAFYHNATLASGGVDWASTAFYTFIGLYLGMIYVARGFGIAVGVHALYDLMVLAFVGR